MEQWRQCGRWLIDCKVLPPNHRVVWPSAVVFDLAQALRDGVLLCQLLHNLSPGSIDLKDINFRPQMSQVRVRARGRPRGGRRARPRRREVDQSPPSPGRAAAACGHGRGAPRAGLRLPGEGETRGRAGRPPLPTPLRPPLPTPLCVLPGPGEPATPGGLARRRALGLRVWWTGPWATSGRGRGGRRGGERGPEGAGGLRAPPPGQGRTSWCDRGSPSLPRHPRVWPLSWPSACGCRPAGKCLRSRQELLFLAP